MLGQGGFHHHAGGGSRYLPLHVILGRAATARARRTLGQGAERPREGKLQVFDGVVNCRRNLAKAALFQVRELGFWDDEEVCALAAAVDAFGHNWSEIAKLLPGRTITHAASGWSIHCGVEVTELSTNKQHTLSRMPMPLGGSALDSHVVYWYSIQ